MKIFTFILSLLLLIPIKLHSEQDYSEFCRPRVIITSDFPPLDVIPCRGATPDDPAEKCSDPDDVQSMVRLLLYSNTLEIEALIATSGTFANVANKHHILEILDVYEEVQPNLAKHDPRYPTASELRSETWQGMDGAWGHPDFKVEPKPIETLIGPDKDTEGSDAIIRIVDKEDERPVWVCVWGGSREVAQAIWKVQMTRNPDELQTFLRKLRIFMIARQDGTADWLLNSFPELKIILSKRNYMGMFWNASSKTEMVDLNWINENIRTNHGPLGAVYPQSGWDPAIPGQWEGDTPSFLYLVSAAYGINNPELPNQESWGGQFIQTDPNIDHWYDSPQGTITVTKWRNDVQKDFLRRINWMLPKEK
ncbi:MAG: DUF1593 domain-containing protein [Opitutales bacterium]|nr:DUF1593 domain-containing protein [Opitutales bacterium]